MSAMCEALQRKPCPKPPFCERCRDGGAERRCPECDTVYFCKPHKQANGQWSKDCLQLAKASGSHKARCKNYQLQRAWSREPLELPPTKLKKVQEGQEKTQKDPGAGIKGIFAASGRLGGGSVGKRAAAQRKLAASRAAGALGGGSQGVGVGSRGSGSTTSTEALRREMAHAM